MMLSSFMAAFSSCSDKVLATLYVLDAVHIAHTKNLVGVGSVGVNGVLDGSLILLDGDLALAGTALVVIVASNAGRGLGGVLGRHFDCVFGEDRRLVVWMFRM